MNSKNENRVCPKCSAEIPEDAPEGLCPKCVMSDLVKGTVIDRPPIDFDEVPSIEDVAEAFPELEILEMIGRGGMSVVFKARQPDLDRVVALKLLPEKMGRDPEFAERFNREARVLAKLNHPNIVTIYEFGHHHPYYFLIMEYVDGVNLRQAMEAGRFSPREALSIVPKICEALQFAHDRNILHRDIKPENLLLDTNGQVKIADFGIAKLVGENSDAEATLTAAGSALGTPHYMAPEQLETPADIDHRADIYSLGVVFYEMLTGRLPVGRFEAPSKRAPLDETIDSIVIRALELDRERRQDSAKELKTEVETVSMGARTVGMDRPGRASNNDGDAVISKSTVASALLTGLGILLPLLPLVISLSTGGGPSIGGLLTVGLPSLLLGLSGTIFGWVALIRIRSGSEGSAAAPLALFGALSYPLAVVTLLTFLVPVSAARAGDFSGLSAFGWGFVTVLLAVLWLAAFTVSSRWLRKRPLFKIGEIVGAVVIVIVCVLLVTPLQRSSTENESEATVSKVTARPERERLPDGVVELVALSHHPSSGTWWNPDGSAWKGAPFENPGHSVGVKSGFKGIEMVFRLHDEGQESAKPRYVFSQGGAFSGGSSPIQDGERVENSSLIATEFPAGLNRAIFSVGLAEGSWKTILERVPSAQGSITIQTPHFREPVHAEFLGAVEDSNGDTRLTVIHNLAEAEVRLVAVGTDGKEIVSRQGLENGSHLTTIFEKRKPEELRTLRLQVRPFRWADFENVALEPWQGSDRKQAASLQSVEMKFQEVSLEQENGGNRIAIHYTRVDRGGRITWKTSGRFDGAPVDLLNSTYVNQNLPEEEQMRHVASIGIPSTMADGEVLDLLSSTRQKWQGRSLVIHPGDQHDILTVMQEEKHRVTVSVAGRSADRKP